MKKLLAFLLLLPSVGFCDGKISAMTSTTSMNTSDIIPVVVNPGTTPANRIITFQNFYNSIPSTITAASIGALTTSSATATYLQLSSATATYLYQSSATVNYVHVLTGSNGITGGGTGGNLTISVSSVSLSTQAIGNLPVTNLNSGTNADSSHFWRGDGLWISSSTFGGSGPALASTQTWTGANAFTSSTTIKGTTTNDNAAVGNYGEYMSSSTAGVGINLPTSNQYGDLVSLVLTAGDWDATFMYATDRNSATQAQYTDVIAGITTTAGNSGTGLLNGDNYGEINLGTTGIADSNVVIANVRFSVSTNTTIYGKYRGTYSGGQPVGYGRLSARRIR